jgi:hypothetical protein
MFPVPLFDLKFLEEIAVWVQELQIGGTSFLRRGKLPWKQDGSYHSLVVYRNSAWRRRPPLQPAAQWSH